MINYNSNKKLNNEWFNLLHTLDKYDDDDTKNTIIIKFTEQLNKDLKNLEQNISVTDCAYNSPRMYNAFDRKHNIAHMLAYSLCPIDETKQLDIEKKKSYIYYQRTLSSLSRAFVEQTNKEETLKNKFKEVRKTYQRKYFCELKSEPISDAIINPTPMPVTVPIVDEFIPFFEHLKANTEVTIPKLEFKRGVQYNDGRMDLCKQVIGPPHIEKLMESLQNNTQITHFLLGNNIIGINGAHHIAQFLNGEHKQQIKTWYLAGNKIDSDGIKLIADALKTDVVCEALWLKRNPLKTEGAKWLGEMLEINKTIKIIDLNNTGILDEGTKYIMESLKKNTSLRHLYLDANGITPIGANYIADYFDFIVGNDIKGITSLWLDINRFDDEGIIKIANSLENYKYLKRLYVGSNRLSDVSTKVLCDTFVNSSTLRIFDLGLYKSTADLGELPNNIGDKGAEHVVEFIKNNKSVEFISVLHNNISTEGVKLLSEALEQNDNICFMLYEQYGNNIPQETRVAIKNKLSQNILKKYNMSLGDYFNGKLRFIKGSKKLKNIDSIYRNRM